MSRAEKTLPNSKPASRAAREAKSVLVKPKHADNFLRHSCRAYSRRECWEKSTSTRWIALGTPEDAYGRFDRVRLQGGIVPRQSNRVRWIRSSALDPCVSHGKIRLYTFGKNECQHQHRLHSQTKMPQRTSSLASLQMLASSPFCVSWLTRRWSAEDLLTATRNELFLTRNCGNVSTHGRNRVD